VSIISISRGTLAGAKRLAEGLAERLGVPCLCREILIEAAQRSGRPLGALAGAIDSPPSFFERASQEREVYLAHIRAALCEQATRGGFVYHGHHAHHLIADVPGVLRVRVVAPIAYRVRAVMGEQGMDARAAERYVETKTKERARWARALYGVEIDDPTLYDLTVNLGQLDVGEAVELVAHLARTPRFSAAAGDPAATANAALASRVRAALAESGDLFTAEAKITAAGDQVTLTGHARNADVRDAIASAARKVAGVADVRCLIRIPSDALRD
jgi:cytidylate kinase